jgi:hypothetical protein
MSRKFTVKELDIEISRYLSQLHSPDFTFERIEIGLIPIYIFYTEDGLEIGKFKIDPGTDISPGAQLILSSDHKVNGSGKFLTSLADALYERIKFLYGLGEYSDIWQEINKSEPLDRTEKQKDLDKACVAWARRGRFPSRNLDEFLQDWYKQTKQYYPKSMFKRALRDAHSRGLIVKGQNGRYTLKSRA